MIIEKDKVYNEYVVWKKEGSALFELFRGNKKDCKEFVKRNKK